MAVMVLCAFEAAIWIMTLGASRVGVVRKCTSTCPEYGKLQSSELHTKTDSLQAEKFENKPWFAADEKAHGYNGPLVTAPHDPAPISSLVLGSYQSEGLPLIPDMFTSGQSGAHGCGHAIRTIHQGVRTMAADYLNDAESKGKLEIKTNVYVDKVLLEVINGDTCAVGVDFQDASGDRTSVVARQEVVLAGGAYGSPTMLLRSGIGEKHELEKQGIECRVDLPGVGKNLMDHIVSRNHFHIVDIHEILICVFCVSTIFIDCLMIRRSQ